jgi:hypothetical protein
MKVMLMDCSYLNLNSMLCKLHQQILLNLNLNLNLNSMEIIYLNLNSMVCKLQVCTVNYSVSFIVLSDSL